MVETLIVPLDGSEVSERVLPLARQIVAEYQAKVRLVSVVEAPTEFSSWAAMPASVHAGEIEQWIDLRRSYLDDIASTFAGADVAVKVDIGPPSVAILNEADAAPQPMIVMASHGRTGLGRLVLGSVTQRIIRRAACPVLVQPVHHGRQIESARFERILAPLDGSEIGKRALDAAREYFDLTPTELTLIQVIEAPDPSAPRIGGIAEPAVNYDVVLRYQESVRQDAESYLQRVAEELRADGIRANWIVCDGHVATEVERVAREQDVQMIVLATRGRGAIGRFLLGSVAERLLADMSRPIFLLGPSDE
ncbi:MAG: universal stress protein [Chloroflexota bacterium]